jgi:phage baseplate assembly protein gpV
MDPFVKNLIRVGVVSSVNSSTGSARVTFSDRSNLVSSELLVMKYAWPVEPGEHVLCIFLPTGNAAGFVLGAYYYENDPPETGGA